MNEEAKDHMVKSRVGLLRLHPFFHSLALRLPLVEDETIPTMATDGRKIYYNPSFALSLPRSEVKGIIAHEVLHCSLLHFARRESRDPERWNIATDYAINLVIRDSGLDLPPCALMDRDYADMSAERIYQLLQQRGESCAGEAWNVGAVMEPADNGKRDADGDGESKAGKGGGGVCPESLRELAQQWTMAARQAATAAKSVGKLPGGLERILGDITAPKLDPADLLSDFIERTAAADYSFTRVNRRYAAHNIIMPGMQSDALPPLVLVNDTSGSRGMEQLTDFASMLSAILSRWKVDITVLHVDSEVARVEELTSYDLPLKLNPSGGGGTDFRPAFDWVRDSGQEFGALLYFTDMWGAFPEQDPGYPVMWISDSGETTAPFGRVVTI